VPFYTRAFLPGRELADAGLSDEERRGLAGPPLSSCVDLVLFWCVLPPAARREFLTAYGAVSEEQLLRARVLSLFFCATLALYGRSEGMGSLRREAVAGLNRTCG
jgi:hypothetical protein